MSQIVTVDFHGDMLLAIERQDLLVAMTPIHCSASAPIDSGS